jgi:hypothetical protein
MKEVALEVKNKALSTRELVKIVKNDKKKADSSSEKVHVRDIHFEEPSISDILLKDGAFALSQDAILGEKRSIVGTNWLESLHFRLIPAGIYQKLEYWLSFELGSTLKPEAWLIRAELALLVGMVLAAIAVWLPVAVLAGILGLLGSLILFLYIS